MQASGQKKDEDKFNETIKRMLETPPKPHDRDKATESQDKKEKPAK